MLRWAMVEVAWGAVRCDPYWKAQYECLKKRGKHANQAIVAIARKLLVAVWHVLSHREPYRHFDAETIAYKMMIWSWQLDEDQRRKLTRPQFARYYLLRLGIGNDLKRIALDPKHPHRLAPVDEVQALFPDLGT